MTIFPLSYLKTTRSKFLSSIVVLLFLSQSSHCVPEPHTEIPSSSTTSPYTNYEIGNLEEYKSFVNCVNCMTIAKDVCLNFNGFYNPEEFMQFLGISHENIEDTSKELNSVSDLKSEEIFYSSESKFTSDNPISSVAMSDFSAIDKRKFSHIESFKLHVSSSIDHLIERTAQSVNSNQITATVKLILSKFSRESHDEVMKGIVRFFPQYHTESEPDSNNNTVDISSSEYQKMQNVISKPSAKKVKLLESVIMALFVEKIVQTYIKTLPSSLQKIEFEIRTNTWAFLSCTKSIENFQQLKEVALVGNYFDEANEQPMQYLYTLPSCETIRLQNLSLINQFFEHLSKLSNEDAWGNSTDEKTHESSTISSFPRLVHLELTFWCQDIFNAEQLIEIGKLQAMKYLTLTDLLENRTSVMQVLKDNVNATSLKSIRIRSMFATFSEPVVIVRNPITGKFDVRHFDQPFNLIKKLKEQFNWITEIPKKIRQKKNSFLRFLKKSFQ